MTLIEVPDQLRKDAMIQVTEELLPNFPFALKRSSDPKHLQKDFELQGAGQGGGEGQTGGPGLPSCLCSWERNAPKRSTDSLRRRSKWCSTVTSDLICL